MRLIAILFVLLAGCASIPPEARNELAPTGTLRAAINYGNGVLAQRDARTGELSGVSVDLSRELARRLGVPLQLVPFDAAGKVTDAVRTGVWDIAFVAIDPKRAEDISFTAPYVVIEGGYMVPAGSRLRNIEDVDRDGVRLAVGNKSAYDLYLSRTLKHAKLVRSPTSPEAPPLFLKEGLDGAAGVKAFLMEFAKTHPEVRVMDGRFMLIQQAMCTPRGRGEAGSRYLSAFVEEMKASGFVANALEKSGQRDAAVAPKAP